MVQSARSSTNHVSLLIGTAEDKLLRAAGHYPYLTAEQATTLLYSPGSLKYVMDRLSKLTAAGYLLRGGQRFGIKSIHVLSTKGSRYVESVGGDVRLSLQPSEFAEKQPQFLLHTMAVNDLLINLELLCQTCPQVRIATILHDLELKRRPVPVTLADGTTRSVISDSWIELHIANRWRECLSPEVDRGFYEQKRWRRKVRSLVAYMKGPYQKAFNTTSLRIPVVATPGTTRRDELKRWTEAELQALGEAQTASFFWFTDQAPQTTTPHGFWLSPVWYAPFAQQPVPLLTVEEAAGL